MKNKLWWLLPLIALLAVLGWVGSGPFRTMGAIGKAIQAEDAAALSAHVDFPALRSNLRAQFEDELARRAGPELQGNPLGALVLGAANTAAGTAVDAMATPAGISALLQGRSLLHRIGGGGDNSDGDTYARATPPDLLRDARYRFESLSRFTATVPNPGGEPVVLVLQRTGLGWKLADIRLPLRANDDAQ